MNICDVTNKSMQCCHQCCQKLDARCQFESSGLDSDSKRMVCLPLLVSSTKPSSALCMSYAHVSCMHACSCTSLSVAFIWGLDQLIEKLPLGHKPTNNGERCRYPKVDLTAFHFFHMQY